MEWEHKIDLKTIIRKYQPTHNDDNQPVSEELIEELKNELSKILVPNIYNLQWELLAVETVEDLNNWLDQLYDFCDVNSIWCGI